MHAMEYYLAIKYSVVPILAIAWMKLEIISVGGRSQSYKSSLCDSIYRNETSRTGKSIESEGRLVVVWGWRMGVWEVTAKGV